MGNLDNIYKGVIECPFSGETCGILKSKADLYINSNRTIVEKQRLLAGTVWRLRASFERYGDESRCAESNSGCSFTLKESEQL